MVADGGERALDVTVVQCDDVPCLQCGDLAARSWVGPVGRCLLRDSAVVEVVHDQDPGHVLVRPLTVASMEVPARSPGDPEELAALAIEHPLLRA